MRNINRLGAALIAVTCLGFSAPAFADETTTTTTHSTTTESAPAVVVEHPPVVVEKRAEPSCVHKKVTKTDEATGDSVSKSETACD